MAQLVEHHLAKVRVAGSNPVVRSNDFMRPVELIRLAFLRTHEATWPSGKAEACKAFITGSNPVVASNHLSYRMGGLIV